MEEWKNIEKTHYSVSNMGKIRNDKTGKILGKGLDKDGYCLTAIPYDGKFKTQKVHRLVAAYFISNPLNLPQVNHINGVKTDNRVENLEWVTALDNLRHAYKNGLHVIKPVYMLNDKKQIIKEFESTREAGKEVGVTNASISSAAREGHKSGGFYWKYAERRENGEKIGELY